MFSETTRIFLAAGSGSSDILLGEIGTWTARVLVAPRPQLDQLSNSEEGRRPGVYLLVGPDPCDASPAA